MLKYKVGEAGRIDGLGAKWAVFRPASPLPEYQYLAITPLTIQESVNQFVVLYQTFAPQLQETEAIFGPERRKHLIELQQRLQRIAQWQQEHHGKSISERPTPTETT